jgi:hypothetical protein
MVIDEGKKGLIRQLLDRTWRDEPVIFRVGWLATSHDWKYVLALPYLLFSSLRFRFTSFYTFRNLGCVIADKATNISMKC